MTAASGLRLLTTDVLYTGMGLPRLDGAVVVSDSTIAATGSRTELLASYPHAAHVGHARIIAPPPVNAHTHLDMSLIPFSALPYFRWIPEVVIANRHLRGLDGARAGLRSLEASGTSTFGDIVWSSDVMDLLLDTPGLSGVAYWEVLDPDPTTAHATFRQTVERIEAWRRRERPDGVRVGLSPHATFTVSHVLFRLLADYARAEGLPLQIHVAEHASELDLFASDSGPLRESLRRARWSEHAEDVFGRAPDPALTPVRHLADLGVLDARPTLVHMVHVTEDDIRTVAQAGCAVVTCPRSNHNLECGRFDWAAFARAGVEVALGTDSVASGETLDIHHEIAAARRLHPDVDVRTLVRAAVKGGARVVGRPVPFLRRGELWTDGYVWADTSTHVT